MASHAPAPGLHVRHAVGLAFTLLAWVIAHQHDVWRPSLGGFVTEAWADVLWAVDLSLAVDALGHLVLLFVRTPLLRGVSELASAVVGLVSLVVAYRVYPFDPGSFDGPFRLFLGFLVVVSAIAIVATAVRVGLGEGASDAA